MIIIVKLLTFLLGHANCVFRITLLMIWGSVINLKLVDAPLDSTTRNGIFPLIWTLQRILQFFFLKELKNGDAHHANRVLQESDQLSGTTIFAPNPKDLPIKGLEMNFGSKIARFLISRNRHLFAQNVMLGTYWSSRPANAFNPQYYRIARLHTVKIDVSNARKATRLIE